MLWFKCDEILPGVSLALLYVALCLSGIFIYMENEVIEDVENSCKIPLSAQENIENFRRKNHSAFVVGYSGEVGRHLLEALNRAKVFNRVVLIGRRMINLDHIGPEFEQNVVDFNLLEDYAHLFKGLEYGFCTLGTSHGSIQSAEFVRVDHDYVLKTAEVAKASGCKHFSVVSSNGADRNSNFFYRRAKGLMEETLKVMHFQRLSIFRPGVLLCDRAEHRPGDTIFQKILRPVAYFFPTAVTLPVETAAVAMLNNAITPTNRTLDVFENKAIHVVAGMAQQFCPPQEPKISAEKTASKKEPESDL
ncbi:oxidoreductase HTATIP2 [Octopus bimaculoides]|uniref:Protein HTATIP2 n=1 Tax=Octopus bimaculoides TaxID=37653 RepID=A0A0L8G7S0_OCTBM|nr:oxidoreductase HTATIP2 [Octopus bimaculoides]|eukprot:XP_014783415.1 PREDICTED: oxidoreductase HTATIP2-like [Octopus bimaculoides]